MVLVERRKEPRYKIRLDVAVVTKDAHSFEATATDISADGMGLQAGRPLLPDTQVVIFMQLQAEVKLRGTVMWVLESYQKGNVMYQMGIKTDVIIFPHKKAYEFKQKTELVQEILSQIKGKKHSVISRETELLSTARIMSRIQAGWAWVF